VVSFMPRPLFPEAIVPGTHRTGGWVGLRAGLLFEKFLGINKVLLVGLIE